MNFNVDHKYSMDEFVESLYDKKPKEPSVYELKRQLSLYVHRWQMSNRKIVISSYAAACVIGAFVFHLPQNAAALDYFFTFLKITGTGLLGCVTSIFITEFFCMLFNGDDYSNGSPVLLFVSSFILIPIVAALICSMNFL